MTDNGRIEAIRQELPATTYSVYLNTGSCGPLPRRTVAVLQTEAERELAAGRVDPKQREHHAALADDLRSRFARLLGARPDEIAFTRHTTDGMNIGIWGLNWQPGDALVTTAFEHQGGIVPAYLAAQRLGLTARVVDLGLGDGDMVGRLEQAITSRTRLLSISHVSWMSGARMPLAEIAEMAHRHHVLVLVDAAQSAGAIPLNVRELDVDMLAVPGQKWLCGPEGVGAFYIRRDRLGEIAPTFSGFSSLASGEHMDYAGAFQLAPGARRYEVGTVYHPSLFAMRESLRWLEEEVGWDWAFARIASLTQRAMELLSQLAGVRIMTPSRQSGLVSFVIEGKAPPDVVAGLAQRGILIRSLPFVNWLRVSAGFYNTEEDLIRLRDALAEIVST